MYCLCIINTAQDRSPFCILDIVNEIWQHLQILRKILVGNHCAFFRMVLKYNTVTSHILKVYIYKNMNLNYIFFFQLHMVMNASNRKSISLCNVSIQS